MITIQSAMLVALGFLAATLLALLVAPAFWARATRLTARRIRAAMPLTEAEIRADKDRIRAEYAIQVHQLESQAEQVRLASARQMIDLNRRDASINELEGELERLKADLEEAHNARRVLEQTVTERLPRVEHRLSDARKLIFNRDREIAELTRTAEKQTKVLAEAAAINAQQMTEIERLTASLAARSTRKEGPSDARSDAEVALRSELEALRTKTRDQSQLIGRMQSQMSRFASYTSPAVRSQADEAAVLANGRGKSGEAADASADSDPAADRSALDDAGAAELRTLRARSQDQAGEIARLKASLAVFEGESEDQKLSIKDSRIGLKARLSSVEAQNEQQKQTIGKIRSELAAANERLARQAAHFTSELKRLGAGTLPASGQPRRQAAAQRLSLAERVVQTRAPGSPGTGQAANGEAKTSGETKNDSSSNVGPNGATVDHDNGQLKRPAAVVSDAVGVAEAGDKSGTAEAGRKQDKGESSEVRVGTGERKSRLLERISGLAKIS